MKTNDKKGKGTVKPTRKPAKQISRKERKDLRNVGIKHPGSLTSLGYHINEPITRKNAALTKAVHKFGKAKTMDKLRDLFRLDQNRPELRRKIKRDMEYVKEKGGK